MTDDLLKALLPTFETRQAFKRLGARVDGLNLIPKACIVPHVET
jgi:hypothetical protein